MFFSSFVGAFLNDNFKYHGTHVAIHVRTYAELLVNSKAGLSMQMCGVMGCGDGLDTNYT